MDEPALGRAPDHHRRHGNEYEPGHSDGSADRPGSANPGNAVRVEGQTSCQASRHGGGRHQGACPIPRLAQHRRLLIDSLKSRVVRQSIAGVIS